MVGSGENARDVITRTSLRQMREGEFVHLTVAPRYEGYHAAIASLFLSESSQRGREMLAATGA